MARIETCTLAKRVLSSLFVLRRACTRTYSCRHTWVHQHVRPAPSGSPASAWAAGASGERRAEISLFGRGGVLSFGTLELDRAGLFFTFLPNLT